jgi:hypothetical protein
MILLMAFQYTNYSHPPEIAMDNEEDQMIDEYPISIVKLYSLFSFSR